MRADRRLLASDVAGGMAAAHEPVGFSMAREMIGHVFWDLKQILLSDSDHYRITLFDTTKQQLTMNGIESLTPPSTDGTETMVFKDDPTWKDGDFVLVSSDGWRFRVPSHPLLSHRWVPLLDPYS